MNELPKKPLEKTVENHAQEYIPTPEDMEEWEPQEYGAYLGMVLACDGKEALAWKMRSNEEGTVQLLLAEGETFLADKGRSGQSQGIELSKNLPRSLVESKQRTYSEGQKHLFRDIWMIAMGRIAPLVEVYSEKLATEFSTKTEEMYEEVLTMIDLTAKDALNRGISEETLTFETLPFPEHHNDKEKQKLYVEIGSLTHRTFQLMGRAMQKRWDSMTEDIWKFAETLAPNEEDAWLRKNWPWLNTLLSEILGAVQPFITERNVQLGSTSMEIGTGKRCKWHNLENELENKKMNLAFENGYRLRKSDGGL